MSGVNPNVITHHLSVYEESKLVVQKKRKLGEERRKVAREETDKLVQAGFIQKAHYTTWLANVVMVKMSNAKWRMCVDYTDLKKACPKDSYPLRRLSIAWLTKRLGIIFSVFLTRTQGTIKSRCTHGIKRKQLS